MMYTSANRDEDVFDDRTRFDIHRNPNPHLSFGIGEHFCLGVHLARLEGRIFLDEMMDRWADVELVGDADTAALEPEQLAGEPARSRCVGELHRGRASR